MWRESRRMPTWGAPLAAMQGLRGLRDLRARQAAVSLQGLQRYRLLWPCPVLALCMVRRSCLPLSCHGVTVARDVCHAQSCAVAACHTDVRYAAPSVSAMPARAAQRGHASMPSESSPPFFCPHFHAMSVCVTDRYSLPLSGV
eukprot:3420200-Rhodomonas_salina.1